MGTAQRAATPRRLEDMKLGTAFAAAAAGGVAYAFAFEPYALAPLVWVALVPLFTVQAFVPRGHVFMAGLLFGLIHAALSIHWMAGIFGLLAVLLFVIYATYFALAFLFVRVATEAWGDRALLWSAPVVLVAFEWIRSEAWWLKFSWFTAGSALVNDVRLLQWASVVGAYGLSALVLFVNASIAMALIDRRCRPAPVAALGIVIAAWMAGKPSPMPEPAGVADVALIEGENIPMAEFSRRIDEARRLAPQTRLVVLPEYATGRRLTDDDELMVILRDAAKRHRITIVFGGTERTGRGSAWHNTLFTIDPDGAVIHRQAKSVPVPFFRDGLPAPDRIPADTPAGRLGLATCYDMDFPFVARELVDEGAELLVFPTMDAEVWGRVQKRQHAALSPLRAVEHRRWLVRCASSGESCIVDPSGAVHRGNGLLTGTVELRRERTAYLRWGWMLPHVCVAGMLAMVFAAIIVERRNARARLRVLPA